MPVVLPDDVASLQSAIRAETIALQAAWTTCRTAGKIADDDPDRDAFAALLRRAADFLARDPSLLDTAAEMDEGQALQRDMAPWYDRIQSKACQAPPQPQHAPAAPGLLASLGNVEEIVKWGVILYIVSQALPMLNPKRRR
jgi:hypothetical protein